MSASDDRIKQLQAEVQHAYNTLSEVTSRLLLANDAAEAILGTDDREELSRRFLGLVARATDTRRAALFVHDGRSLTLGATLGLSSAEEDALVESAEIAARCEEALERGEMLIVDPDLVESDQSEYEKAESRDEADQSELKKADSRQQADEERPEEEATDQERDVEDESDENASADEEPEP